MQDAFAHGAELVRAADHDRFIASLFAPAEHRGAIYALYAFNCEVARVREVAREPLPGEIRLQWWSDVINRQRSDEARANPVASALLTTIERYRLSSAKLIDLIEARRFDLYDEPMAALTDLEAYASKTSSALFALAAQILAGVDAEAVSTPAGIAFAIAGLLRAFPRHATRGQLYLPMELLDRHQVRPDDIFAGRSSAGLQAALAELGDLGRRHLDAAHQRMAALPRQAVPALLPVALARPTLVRLERCDPFSPAEIAPWRRQWLIWRAARNPARIAG
ncbi:MAG TPA: phytoene/squalene synthase family protein [Xanthobacteraceae bacterium]|nr:phytoene/squalene synthase family protein [Xanthobacteraceae bacterium]